MIQGFRIRRLPVADKPTGGFRGVQLVAAAALLSFGVILWMHGLHSAGLTGLNSWAGALPQIVRNGVLAFPLALAAAVLGGWLAVHAGSEARSARGVLTEAALTALVFALLLAVTTEPHKILDRAIDSAVRAHAFHGQSRAS